MDGALGGLTHVPDEPKGTVPPNGKGNRPRIGPDAEPAGTRGPGRLGDGSSTDQPQLYVPAFGSAELSMTTVFITLSAIVCFLASHSGKSRPM